VKVTRRFTVKGKSPYEGIPFAKRHSEIRNPNGSLVFEARDIDVPAHWSQVAVDILAQKYFRKAGVPQRDAEYMNDTGHAIARAWYWVVLPGLVLNYFGQGAHALAHPDDLLARDQRLLQDLRIEFVPPRIQRW